MMSVKNKYVMMLKIHPVHPNCLMQKTYPFNKLQWIQTGQEKNG